MPFEKAMLFTVKTSAQKGTALQMDGLCQGYGRKQKAPPAS